MDHRENRALTKLIVYAVVAIGAMCYGAYQANPALAIGCVVAIGAFAGIGWAIAKHKENQVKKMIADVESGADRFVRGSDER